MDTPILSVRDLNVMFNLRGKKLHAIRNVSLDIYRGESLAIVGESGSGKSVFVKTFMGLLDANGWKLTKYGDKSTLAKEKVDSNKFGFTLRLGGGSLYSTDGASESGETLISSPQTGCYMCGAGDTTGNSLAVYYDAIVTPLSRAVVDANIADVVFVVEWDT